MNYFSFLTVALKNLKRKPFRTAVLASAIALLVTLLIFATSFTISVSSSLKKSADRLGADLIVVPVGARGFAEEFLLESKNTAFYMPKTVIDRIKAVEGVESVTYQTYLSSIAGLCCDIIPTRIVAFHQDSDFIIRPWLQEAIGRELEKGEAIAGFGTSENLGLGLLAIETTIFDNRFTMVGVLEQTGTGLDNALFMTEENLKGIIESGKSPLKKGEISIIFTKLKKGFSPDYVGKIIEGNNPDVDIVARSGMGEKFLTILGDINKIFVVTILLSSLLTILLVCTIFSAIAHERAKEIGIMRAIGYWCKRSAHRQTFYSRGVSTGLGRKFCRGSYGHLPLEHPCRIFYPSKKHFREPYRSGTDCHRLDRTPCRVRNLRGRSNVADQSDKETGTPSGN